MPFPYNSQTYYEFFEAIAINHIDIQHNPDRVENEVRFGEIYISSDPFDKIDLSSFMDDKRSKIQYPLLLMVGSDWDATGKGSQTNALVNASFIVLDKGDKTKETKADIRRSAYVKTEAIAEDIVAYIKEYFRLNVVLGTLFIDSIKSSKIGPLPEGTYGTKVDFNYLNRNSNFCFNQDKFLLLAPAVDAVPDKCDPVPNPDYCDLFFSKLSVQQKACLDAVYTFESDFTANVTEIEEGQSVTFTPDYDDADVYYWDFGDGTTSTLKTPTHTYTTAGSYTVCLILVDGDKHSKVVKVGYISVVEPDLDLDLLAFLTASGITDETIINGLIDFVATLKFTNIWDKMKAIYPFVGGTSSSHKWNLKDPRDLNEAYRLTFFNSWSHSSNGAKGSPYANNTYMQTYLNAQTAIPSGLISFGSYRGEALAIGIGMGVENYSIYEWPEEYQVAISGAANVLRHLNGMGQVTKSSSTEVKYTRNNIVDTISGSYGALPNSQFNIGGIQAGYGVSWLLKFAYISEALTSSQTQELYAAVHQLQIALNREES